VCATYGGDGHLSGCPFLTLSWDKFANEQTKKEYNSGMEDKKGWTVNGAEWTVYATLAGQAATPIIQTRTVRAGLSQDNSGGNGRVRSRRVHPSVVRELMKEQG
jgi:hypothetical protein